MQHAVYLAVALAVAAAVLSIAVAMKAVLPAPEAPLEYAEALVYVKVKPLNGSYWLGVYAPYGDVVVKQVRVNNTAYELGVTAPAGRDVWLNASGRPITAHCGDSLEIVTAKGSAVRSLAFTVQCPVVRQDAYVHQLKVLERYAYNAIKYVLGFNETKITIRVRELGYVEVVNISPDPLLLVFDQAPKTSTGWARQYLTYFSVPPQGDPQSAVGQPTWVQHVYLPPNGSVKLKVNSNLATLISVYPAQYYYYNPANTTAIGSYLAAISPWRVVNMKVDANYTTDKRGDNVITIIHSTAVEFLNESGMPQVAGQRNVVYKAYGDVQFYIDDRGLVWLELPPHGYGPPCYSGLGRCVGVQQIEWGDVAYEVSFTAEDGWTEVRRWYAINNILIHLTAWSHDGWYWFYGITPTVVRYPGEPWKDYAYFEPIYVAGGKIKFTISYDKPTIKIDEDRKIRYVEYKSVKVDAGYAVGQGFTPGFPGGRIEFWRSWGTEYISIYDDGYWTHFCTFPATSRWWAICGPYFVQWYKYSRDGYNWQWVAESYRVFGVGIPLITYYVSNAPNAYNYVLEASTSYCPGGGSTKATLYKLDRYDWSKREKVAEASYSVPCDGGGSGSHSYTCSGVYPELIGAADAWVANKTGNSYTFGYKLFFALKACNGTIVGYDNKIVYETVGTLLNNVYVEDHKDRRKVCPIYNATSTTTESGQMILTCKK